MPALPSIEINPPGRLWLYWGPFVVIPLGVGIFGGDGLVDVLVTGAVVVGLGAVVVLLLLRHLRRDQAKRLAAAPAGTAFASHALAMRPRAVHDLDKVPPIEDRLGAELQVAPTGLAYRSPDLPGTELDWAQVERLVVRYDFFYGPHRAVLEAWTTDGRVLSWLVPGAPGLVAGLGRLQG